MRRNTVPPNAVSRLAHRGIMAPGSNSVNWIFGRLDCHFLSGIADFAFAPKSCTVYVIFIFIATQSPNCMVIFSSIAAVPKGMLLCGHTDCETSYFSPLGELGPSEISSFDVVPFLIFNCPFW